MLSLFLCNLERESMKKVQIQAVETDQLIGRKVRVYYNLYRKIWSIQDIKTRKVIGRSAFLRLANVEFKVSQAGRERVLRERKKNVHAFAIGTVEDFSTSGLKDTFDIVMYNPYKYETFVTQVGERAVYHAMKVWFYSTNALVIASGINP